MKANVALVLLFALSNVAIEAKVPASDCPKARSLALLVSQNANELQPALFNAVEGMPTEEVITVKIGLMLPLDVAELKQSFGYAVSASAVTMALERVRHEHLLDAVSWQSVHFTISLRAPLFVWYWPECVESWAAGIASTLFVTDKVDVIIGPPCSIAAIVAGIMGKFYNVPLVSWAASSPELNHRIRFPTMARTVPSGIKLGEAVFETLTFFDWRRYALLYSDDAQRRKCHFFQDGLEARFIAQDNTDVDKRIRFAFKMTIEDGDYKRRIEAFLDIMPSEARIAVVCLDQQEQVRHFLKRVHQRGLDTDEYVFILPDYLPIYSTPDIWVDYSHPPDGLNDDALAAMRKSLVIYMEQLSDDQLDRFKREVPRKMVEWPYCYRPDPLPADEQYGSTFSPFMYDAMYLYALGLNKTLNEGLTKRNGSTIIEHTIGQQFHGMSGEVSINEYGSREPRFVVMGLNASDKLITFGTLEVTRIDATTFKRKMKPSQPASVIWASRAGIQPSWQPPCGFNNENCAEKDGSGSLFMVVTILLLVIAVLATLLILLLYISFRHRKQSEPWNIMPAELTWPDQMISSNNLSTDSVDIESRAEDGTSGAFELHYYRGNLVSSIQHNKFKNASIDARELRAMHALDNDNVNGFLGICVEVEGMATVRCVWRHCANGILQDILRKYTARLDQFFLLSLIRDLVHGIEYIHKTALGSHGRLTSLNCLIDHRWQLKLCGFGPSCIYGPLSKSDTPNELLWTAPELLRIAEPPQRGTKEGDVYSLAIVMSEIFSAKPAYSNVCESTTIDEIILLVRRGGTNPMRPKISVPTNMSIHKTLLPLMRHCWEEDPQKRPSIRALKMVLNTLMKGESGTLMDHVMRLTETHAVSLEKEVAERTNELAQEKKKADDLLYRMLPQLTADQLKAGMEVLPHLYEGATIFFSDVVGFTILASRSTPMQLVALLNSLYTTFDAIIMKHDVYKVETIGDGYLVVSGLPHPNGDKHASEVADMALQIMGAIASCSVPHLPGEHMQLRIGIHTGPTVAGVIGSAMPRYCLFGDSVNTASRMESHGQPGCIQISTETNRYLTKVIGGYKTQERGEILIKGKGPMTTFWLLGKEEMTMAFEVHAVNRPETTENPIDYASVCIV